MPSFFGSFARSKQYLHEHWLNLGVEHAPPDASCTRSSSAQLPCWSFYRHNEAQKTLLHRIKFADEPGHLRHLCRGFEMPQKVVKATALMPIPMHPLDLAARGYNPAALLAGHLSVLWGLPMLPRYLKRRSAGSHQKGADRSLRLEQAMQLYTLSRALKTADAVQLSSALAANQPQEKIILVDDVVTTGATLSACAKVLQDCGHEVIGAVTLTYVP